MFRRINFGIKPPKWFSGQSVIEGVLSYFCVNIMLITMSTIMVALGRFVPIDRVRLFIILQIPYKFPQIINYELNPVLLHLSYRFYSVMLSSFILGTILSIIFKPRTWCVVCPINTLSNRGLR